MPVAVEVEVRGDFLVEQGVANVGVDAIGDAQVAADVALEQPVAVLLEETVEFVHRDPAHQHAA